MNIYLLNVMSISEHDVQEYAYLLDEDRQSAIARYQRSADRRRSFGAGIALSYAWRQRYQDQAMPKIVREADGKPYFVGIKLPFGLSHSGIYAACVLGEETERAVGLDVQEPRTVRERAAERFFSDGERAQLWAGDDFCLIWSRKESLAKYIGSGLSGELRQFDTAGSKPEHGGGGEIGVCLETVAGSKPEHGGGGETCVCLETEAGKKAYLWSCVTADGYAVSVCAEKPVSWRLVFLEWEQIKKELRRETSGAPSGLRL